MKNLAGVSGCDLIIIKELDEAGVNVHGLPFILNGEVPTSVYGTLDGWGFKRAGRYWVAESGESLLLFDYAFDLHDIYGEEVRVNGDCMCPSPLEDNNEPWHIGVSSYHVDTQEGLNALCDAIRRQTDGN